MSGIESIERKNVEDIYGLCPLQKGIFFHYLTKPDSDSYLAQLTLSLRGNININLFKKALKTVTANNEMLRTVFRWEGLVNPVQIVLKDYEIPVFIYDFSNISENDTVKEVERLKKSVRARKIDIAKSPVEIMLVRISDRRCEMVLSWHHIVYDGWSNAIFLRETMTAYDSLINGIPVKSTAKRRYKEFVKWCESRDEEQQQNYWRDYFKGLKKKTPLPLNKRKKVDTAAITGYHTFTLPEELLSKVHRFLSSGNNTFAILVYCAWAILLHKYTGENDIVFGTTVSGRLAGIENIESIIGLFINTLPLRVKTDDTEKVSDILKDIGRTKESWADYEASDLVKIKGCSRVDAKDTLFDSIVVVENYPLDMDKWVSSDKSTIGIEAFDIVEKTDFSILLGVLLPHNNILTFQYDTLIYTAEDIKNIAEHYLYILDKIVNDRDIRLSGIEMTPVKESEEALLEAEESEDEYTAGNKDIYVPPGDETEESLAAVWKELLNLERVSVNSNFFDIGGNSILLLKMVAKLSRVYPKAVSAADAFSYPTIEQLAGIITGKTGRTDSKRVFKHEDILRMAVRLPSDYIKTGSSGIRDKTALEYVFDKPSGLKILQVSKKLGINELSLMLAVYIHLISLISKEKQITIHTLTGVEESIKPVTTDFNSIKDLKALILHADNAMSKSGKNEVYSIKQINTIELNRDSTYVLPLFYNSSLYDFRQELLERFNITLGAAGVDNEISIIYRYNEARIDNGKAKELLSLFINYIKNVVTKLEL